MNGERSDATMAAARAKGSAANRSKRLVRMQKMRGQTHLRTAKEWAALLGISERIAWDYAKELGEKLKSQAPAQSEPHGITEEEVRWRIQRMQEYAQRTANKLARLRYTL